MTTVAWDGVTLAADGRLADSTILTTDYQKIFRIGNRMVGMAGDAEQLERMRQFLLSGAKGKPPRFKKLSVLYIEADGSATVSDFGGTPMRVDVPCAIGSGRDHALGAMDSGATAVQAVRAAKKRDPMSGGRIRTLKLR